jgi:O-antigen/teichoic acid export membrane protein
MKQKFISNLFFLILANVIIKPFWIFGIDRHLQNSINTSDYGAYFAVFNFSFLLHIILDGGINNFNNIEVSRDATYLKKNLSNLFYLKLILSFVYLLVTFSIVCFTSYDTNQIQMLFALMINMILLNLILFFRSNVAALQYFKTDSLLSVLDRFLAIIFCVLLIVFHQFSLFNFIFAQTLALFISLLVSVYVVYIIGQPTLHPFNKNHLLDILKESYPFAILGVLMSIYYRIDAVMIEQLLPNGKEQAGIYAASYRLLDALNMIAFLVASLLLPLFSKSIKHREILHLKKLVLFASGILLCMSVVVFVVAYFQSNWIMTHLYKHATTSWSEVFWVLLFSFIPISLTYVFGTFLTANKNLSYLNIISLIALIINVILNFVLIPKQYALGACIATGVTQVFVVSLQIIYVLYILYFKPEKLKYETTVTTIS